MHTPETIAQLLKQGEGPTLEFKVSTPHPVDLSRLISGLANTSGGTVLVGVREPATIVGTDIERFKRIVQLARTRIHGEVGLVDYSVDVDGKRIGLIEVKRASIPVASPEGYFFDVKLQNRMRPQSPAWYKYQASVRQVDAVLEHAKVVSSSFADQKNTIHKILKRNQ